MTTLITHTTSTNCSKGTSLRKNEVVQRNTPIPVCDVNWQYALLSAEINAAIKQVAQNGKYILGPNVKAFEKEAATFFGARDAVGVGSGTDALHLALRALGIGAGDEVITSPFTFIATTEAIGLVGAKPVFVDIEPSTFNIAPHRIESKITRRTKAVIPVHLYGQPCEMDAIMRIAKMNNLHVIEDCAQAFGATFHGRPVGTFGDVGCYSFFPTKNLGCMGDGGLVIAKNSDILGRVEMLRRHGGRKKYHHEELGLNSRLDEIQAAILRIKLPLVKKWNRLRQTAANCYSTLLKNLESGGQICTPSAVGKSEVTNINNHDLQHVFHQYTIRCSNRDSLAEHLNSAGISTAVYYPTPLHQQPVHLKQGICASGLINSDKAAKEVLSLPMFPGLTDEQITRVCSEIKNWCSKY